MGSVIRLTLEHLPAALDLGEKRIRRGVARGAQRGAKLALRTIRERTPRDQNELRNGWRVVPGAEEFRGRNTKLAELVNKAPHLGWVEKGTRPHRVSPEGWRAIYEWVRRHFRGGELGGKGRAPSHQSHRGYRPWTGPDPMLTKITNAIVWKIRHRGSKPTFFVRDSLEELFAIMIAEVGAELARVEAEAGR